MWPISTRVNKPENDEPSVLDPIVQHSVAGDREHRAAARSK
jgi:hypothetical protein